MLSQTSAMVRVSKFVRIIHQCKRSCEDARRDWIWTNAYTATDVPTSTGSVKPSGTGASASASGTGSSNDSSSNSTLATATGAAPKPSGSAVGSATGTSTGALAESTGAAGKLEVGLAAAIAGLMAIAL